MPSSTIGFGGAQQASLVKACSTIVCGVIKRPKERLKRVHGDLTDPLIRRSISDIVYDAGFGDVSHFNRAFRRRYGASPSEVRHHDMVRTNGEVASG